MDKQRLEARLATLKCSLKETGYRPAGEHEEISGAEASQLFVRRDRRAEFINSGAHNVVTIKK